MDRDLRLAGLTVSLAVLAAAVACSNGQPPREAPARATALRAIAPSGETEWPFTFRWDGVQPDAVVQIRVVDEAERLLLAFGARGTSVPAPDALRAQLRPATRYQWSVDYQEPGDATASPLTEFTIRSAP